MNNDGIIQLALKHLQTGNLQQAEIFFREILSDHPNDINALHFLGLVYYEKEDYDLAVEYIQKALSVNPAYADAYNNLGLALLAKKEFEKAIMCYQKALELKPEFEAADANLKYILSESGYLDKVIEDYKEALFKCINFMETTPDKNITERKRIKILVTGTGRCGTGYMAKLLTSAGFSCGHEEIFSFLVNTEKLLQNHSICESSWLAAPFLSSSWLYNTVFIHAVRNPLRTIESLIEINFFPEKNFYYHFIEHFLPEIKTVHPDKAPFYYFVKWTKMILRYEKEARYLRHKVENDPVALIKKIEGDITHLFSNKAYNTRRKPGINIHLTPDEIPKEYKTEFMEISEHIGYKLE